MSVGKTIKDYFKRHKFRLIMIIIVIIGVTLLALLPAQLLKKIIDDVIPSENKKRLLSFAIIYATTFFAIGVASFIKDMIMLGTSQRITSCLKCNMMKHVQKMSYKEIVNSDSGSLEAYFNNDVNSINELFTSGVVNIVTDVFKMIGIVILIFIFSVMFGFFVLGILPIMVIFTSIVRKKMLKAQIKTKSLEGSVNKGLLENIENIEQIKVNKAEKYSIDKYDNIIKNHFKAKQNSAIYDAFFSPVMSIIRNIVICSILLISGFNPNFFGMTIGTIIAVISLLTDLFTPIENIGMEIQTIQKSVAAVKRINSFFKLEEEGEKKEFKLENYDIEYKDVCFGYGEKEVISNFSLKIKEGEKIALQGPSGSGKSTLMKLAMGLITPDFGRITIGGFDNASLNDEMKKKLFAVVYQDPFFSQGTIYEEISLKNAKISKEEVKKALNDVGLGYISDIDIILNDKEYSSGELALFNIARIIVRNPKVIFLDEMNAKIDPLTSKMIIKLINQIAKDKIVISINHYGNTLDNAKIVTKFNGI